MTIVLKDDVRKTLTDNIDRLCDAVEAMNSTSFRGVEGYRQLVTGEAISLRQTTRIIFGERDHV